MSTSVQERRFTLLLRLLHVQGGTVYEEKLPRCLDDLRAMEKAKLVAFRQLSGERAPRVDHARVQVTSAGLAWLEERDCRTFGWEARHGLRQCDRDFSRFLLEGDMPTVHNADRKE